MARSATIDIHIASSPSSPEGPRGPLQVPVYPQARTWESGHSRAPASATPNADNSASTSSRRRRWACRFGTAASAPRDAEAHYCAWPVAFSGSCASWYAGKLAISWSSRSTVCSSGALADSTAHEAGERHAGYWRQLLAAEPVGSALSAGCAWCPRSGCFRTVSARPVCPAAISAGPRHSVVTTGETSERDWDSCSTQARTGCHDPGHTGTTTTANGPNPDHADSSCPARLNFQPGGRVADSVQV